MHARHVAIVLLLATTVVRAEPRLGAAISTMPRGRSDATLTVLGDGRVVAIGGAIEGWQSTVLVDVYDPRRDTWSHARSMRRGRTGHTATRLVDGRVLVVGGSELEWVRGENAWLASDNEIWDAAADRWTIAGALVVARDQHTATLLADGRVLIAGGQDHANHGPIATTEIFEPATAKFASAGRLATPRMFHATVALPGGGAAVLGGLSSDPARIGVLASIEVWDPAARAWTAGPHLMRARASLSATLLGDGKLLVIGGSDEHHQPIALAELCDLAARTCTAAGSLATARSEHTALALPDGRVLVVGGWTGTNPSAPDVVTSVEVWSGAFRTLGRLLSRKPKVAAALLPDGAVVVGGGRGQTAIEVFRL